MVIRVREKYEPHRGMGEKLQQLEVEAFASLISEKLAADEGFRIFIEWLTLTHQQDQMYDNGKARYR